MIWNCIIIVSSRSSPCCSCVCVWISRCCCTERCCSDDWTDPENRRVNTSTSLTLYLSFLVKTHTCLIWTEWVILSHCEAEIILISMLLFSFHSHIFIGAIISLIISCSCCKWNTVVYSHPQLMEKEPLEIWGSSSFPLNSSSLYFWWFYWYLNPVSITWT